MVHTSDMNILSVLEFAVDHLKVEHVVVCGHYGCGGVQQALASARGSMLDHWLQPLTMMYHKHRSLIDAIPSEAARLDRLCEINIEMQVRRVAATPIVENAWARGQELHLHGWIYAIHDGLLRDLGPHLSSIAERDALPSIDRRVVDPVEPVSAMRRQAMDVFAKFEPSAPCLQPCGALADETRSLHSQTEIG
jgi:carbonic anhydrase